MAALLSGVCARNRALKTQNDMLSSSVGKIQEQLAKKGVANWTSSQTVGNKFPAIDVKGPFFEVFACGTNTHACRSL